MEFVTVCIRIPKSGSSSLSRVLRDAFSGARTFYLYNTISPDSAISPLQRWRYRRSLARNLYRRYRTVDQAKVYGIISKEAANGDLIDGGHIDFASVRANVKRPLKMVTLLRDPVERIRSHYSYARQAMKAKNVLTRLDAPVLPKIASVRDFAASSISYLSTARPMAISPAAVSAETAWTIWRIISRRMCFMPVCWSKARASSKVFRKNWAGRLNSPTTIA